jgi:hypothetical protein
MELSSSFSFPGPRYGPLPAHAREWADIRRDQNAMGERRAAELAEERRRHEYQMSRVFAELLRIFGRRWRRLEARAAE